MLGAERREEDHVMDPNLRLEKSSVHNDSKTDVTGSCSLVSISLTNISVRHSRVKMYLYYVSLKTGKYYV